MQQNQDFVTLNIAFCVDNSYALYIGVAIKSILENHKDSQVYLNIHVVTDKISNKNRKKLEKIVRFYPFAKLCFYCVDDKVLMDLPLEQWPIHAWYRILLPTVLPPEIEIVLYLDADTVVASTLDELNDINMNDYSVAGVLEDHCYEDAHYNRLGYISDKSYFCSGVLLINLNYWRKNNMTQKIINFALNNQDKLTYPDQDSINVVCKDSKKILPLKFGVLNEFFYNQNFYLNLKEELIEAYKNPIIIHYAGFAPWLHHKEDHIHRWIWFKYRDCLSYRIPLIYYSKGIMKLKIRVFETIYGVRERLRFPRHYIESKLLEQK